jgi:hypothetical protein
MSDNIIKILNENNTIIIAGIEFVLLKKYVNEYSMIPKPCGAKIAMFPIAQETKYAPVKSIKCPFIK